MAGADEIAESDIEREGGWSEQGLVGNVSSTGDLSFIGKQRLRVDS